MNVEEKIKSLNIELPKMPRQSGNYVLSKKIGNLLYISGITCKNNGIVQYKGKIGDNITIEEGYAAAKLCALNILAVIKQETGSLNNVKQIVKMVGYVNCVSIFSEHPEVINGSSDVFLELYGESGKHARCAVGVNSLPGEASVEADVIVELK